MIGVEEYMQRKDEMMSLPTGDDNKLSEHVHLKIS